MRIDKSLFSESDVGAAIQECNFTKALGEDWLVGDVFKDPSLGPILKAQVVEMLNSGWFPNYIKTSRLQALSKTDQSEVYIDQVRGIAIASHITKIIEKSIMLKVKQLKSELFKVGDYQAGFQEGKSTSRNLAAVLNLIFRGRKKKSERRIYASIDLTKAYDNVNRTLMLNVLKARAKSEEEKHVVSLIQNLYFAPRI